MKSKAVTLVHRGAMEIATHAVASFARHFSSSHILEIHTDGSPAEADEQLLLQSAAGMKARIVRPADRQDTLHAAFADQPDLLTLFGRGGYFAKLQLAITIPPPFFYFDSDIVWLRPVENLSSKEAPNTFSTESWSWYFGLQNDSAWIRQRVPRRVNSGFYHLSTAFPTDRFAQLFRESLYTPDHRYSTDQEIMAFLYPDLDYYHPEDFKRSRRGIAYDLLSDRAAALHFPGRMWEEHLGQIRQLEQTSGRPPIRIRYQPSVPLDRPELWRMRATLAAAATPALRRPIDWFRRIRATMSSKS